MKHRQSATDIDAFVSEMVGYSKCTAERDAAVEDAKVPTRDMPIAEGPDSQEPDDTIHAVARDEPWLNVSWLHMATRG